MNKDALKLLKSETQKMLSGIVKSGKKDVFKNVGKTLDEFEKAGANLGLLFELGKKTSDRKDFSILMIATFLWTFEGFYVCRLNLFCLLLIENGHDLFDPIRRKYVCTLEEIGEVDLSTKLKFLSIHKFGALQRKQDQRFRNRIAHHDFSLKEDGNILIDNQIVDVMSRLSDLYDFIHQINLILLELWDKLFE